MNVEYGLTYGDIICWVIRQAVKFINDFIIYFSEIHFDFCPIFCVHVDSGIPKKFLALKQ